MLTTSVGFSKQNNEALWVRGAGLVEPAGREMFWWGSGAVATDLHGGTAGL